MPTVAFTEVIKTEFVLYSMLPYFLITHIASPPWVVVLAFLLLEPFHLVWVLVKHFA